MPNASAFLARVRTRSRWVLFLLTLTASVVGQQAPAGAQVVAPRPVFKSPFACGSVWFARTYRGHPKYAVDWNMNGGGEADFGQPVLAGAPGVASVGRDSGYGNMVTIDHGNGWKTLLAHLSAITVASGQPVAADTMIGRVGRTGRSDGSHLHQEISLNGVRQPVALDSVVIFVSGSSRGASYASTNCPPPPPVKLKASAWGHCRIRACAN